MFIENTIKIKYDEKEKFHIWFQKYPIEKTHWKKQKFIVENTKRSSKKDLYSSFSQPRFECVGGGGMGGGRKTADSSSIREFCGLFILYFLVILGKPLSHQRFLE